jgi:predicted nucleic acid-binding protein
VVLVDTNVLVALLVRNTPWYEQARSLYERDKDWRSESHAMVELTNVLLRCVRVDEFEVGAALAMLEFAERRFTAGLLFAPHAAAMRVALNRGISAYDARFLVTADELDVKLVTEDAKLRRAAPELTQSLDEALAA